MGEERAETVIVDAEGAGGSFVAVEARSYERVTSVVTSVVSKL